MKKCLEVSVESEITDSVRHLTDLLNSYTTLWDNITIGETENMYFRDLVEFVNLRAETISSIMHLLKANQVSAALALCRPLLENLLLFKLMTSGHRHYLVRTVPAGIDRREYLKKMNLPSREKDDLFVRANVDERHPKRVLIVYHELRRTDPSDLKIPLHYFLHMDQNPTSAFLNFEKYYSPFPQSSEMETAFRKIRHESKFVYENYLNFASLKRCLRLNNLLDSRNETAVDAHYTFLGGFIHPKVDATRNISETSNTHYGSSGIGLQNRYSSHSVLLGYMYAIHLLTSFIKLLIEVLAKAPKKHILETGTGDLERKLTSTQERFDYFWFLQSKPPFFDRYRAARSDLNFLHRDLHFSKFPLQQVKFDKDIYERLKQSLLPQTDQSLGSYSALWGQTR